MEERIAKRAVEHRGGLDRRIKGTGTKVLDEAPRGEPERHTIN